MQAAIRIIGIDPGLRRTGWGVIDVEGSALRFVGSGTVRSDDKAALSDRLCQIHTGLTAVLNEQAPHEAAVEETFVNKDAGATLKLGQARGVAMLVPAMAGLTVAEYAPNAVKKAVIGVGHGEKKQIHMMVKVLMPRATFDTDDAADALAIAICHAHHRQSAVAMARMATVGQSKPKTQTEKPATQNRLERFVTSLRKLEGTGDQTIDADPVIRGTRRG